MRLRLAIQGNLRETLERDYAAAESAVTAAVKEAGDGLKKDLRQDVQGAGLGRRLANTWRTAIYPRSQKSAGAAALVYSKAPEIIRAHTEGATIRASSSRFLAIPTESVPRARPGQERITPSNWPEHRLGPLRFVKTRRGAMLVVDGVRVSASGRVSRIRSRAATSRRGATSGLAGRATVPMFILVRQVRLKKKLDLDGPAQKWLNRLPRLILRHWPDNR